MERAEFTQTVDTMLSDAEAIVYNQQVLANVHTQLNHNLLNPLEQDFIYEAHFGAKPSEPRLIRHGNVAITTRILHQTGTGLRDIQGAIYYMRLKAKSSG